MATLTTTHPTATREEWLKARLDLLKAEKELTRKSDEVAQQRQALPWVKIEKKYRFQTCQGEKGLEDLFHGRSQLLVYHFMFGPDYKAGCPSCSAIADGFNGFWEHLAHHDVMLETRRRANGLAHARQHAQPLTVAGPARERKSLEIAREADARGQYDAGVIAGRIQPTHAAIGKQRQVQRHSNTLI